MANNQNTEKYDSKKVVRMVIFGLAIIIFIMTMILTLNDFDGIWGVLKTTNVRYLMFAVLLLLIYMVLYPIPLCILTKTRGCKISFLNTYLIGSTEHFFNGITPFATGGQPFQVYAYNRLGVKPAESTGILMMNFITFMIVTNIYALTSLFFYPKLAQNISNLNAMVIIGFTINFSVLLFLFSVATSKKLRVWLEKILLWLCKAKCLRRFIEPNIPKLNDYCYQAQNAFKELWKNKKAFLLCFFIRFITMGVYYAITFFILKALNVEVGADKLIFIICSTAFAITMCVFIPTPGSSGGIEFAFKSIFQAVAIGITTEVAFGGMLLWRGLSYVLTMVISFFIYLLLEKITLKREKEIMSIIPNHRKKRNDKALEDVAVLDTKDSENDSGENNEGIEEPESDNNTSENSAENNENDDNAVFVKPNINIDTAKEN